MFSRRLFGVVVLGISALLAGCSTGRMPTAGPGGAVSAPENDLVASYRRSRAEAPPAPPFQDFGSLEGNQLTLRANPTLLNEQVRDVCDNKPYLVPSTWQEPKCALWGVMGCRRYQVGQSESQPPCQVPNTMGECFRRATPTPPPPRFDYVRDCYRGVPEAGVPGQIDVYAVPATTPKDKIVDYGRRVGSFRLKLDGSPQTLPLPDLSAGQCFGLADSSGKPIDLRGNEVSAGRHLFAPATLKEKMAAAAREDAVKQAEDRVVQARKDLNWITSTVTSNPAWKNNQCVLPPQAALPERPKTLSESEIDMSGKAFCLLLLRDQFEADIVDKAARAQQKYSFISAAEAFNFKVTRTASCSRGYAYSDGDLAYLRGEHIQRNTTEPGLAGIIGGILKGTDETIRVTQGGRYKMIDGMLESCYRAARYNCAQPLTSWERMVADIKAWPQQTKAQCEADYGRSVKVAQAVKDAESALASARAVAAAQRAAPAMAAMRLSLATCQAQ